MLTSVKAFGTGGKRKKIFQDIYFSVEDVDGIGVLYTKTGEYSAILKLENPVQKYSANIELLPLFHWTHLYRCSDLSNHHAGKQKEPSFLL